MWEVEAPLPLARPGLAPATVTGGEETYETCQAEARRLRRAGEPGLVAPSAALLSGEAEQYSVDGGGQFVRSHVPAETVVVWGSQTELVGMPVAEGHPDSFVLADVRHLE